MENKLLDVVKGYLIFTVICLIVMIVLNPLIGAVAFILNIYGTWTLVKNIREKEKGFKKYVENINTDFDSITKQVIFNMPFPLVVTDENGNIIWYNSPFLNIYKDQDIMNKPIKNIVTKLDVDEVLLGNIKETFPLKIEGLDYTVYPNIIDVSKNDSDRNKIAMFYFVNDTHFKKLEQKYIDENTIIARIEVDNFDEAMDSTPSSNRPQLIAEIDSTIKSYFEYYDALVRKYDSDMYLVVMSFKSLKMIKEKRFDILDDLRELDKGNAIPITLSIGVSSFGLSYKNAYDESDTCLDLALGRGGDQAVVKVEDNYEFFGGKSKAVEKRNKVKARVLGIALRQLIDGASDVYIMGHKNPDMDAIGSAVGVLRAVLNRGKTGHIVLNDSNPSIDNLVERMKIEEPEMYDMIVTGEYAVGNIKTNSLLILVDIHKPSFTECPELIDETSQIVIIDHHRRGKEFVDDPVLTYIEPYASSASELVTEMLVYMSDDLNLTHFEADALMSGIVVDTKNFSFQTGVRTFEAASMLKRAGADMIKVKQLFRDDLDTLLNKAEVVHNTKVIFKEIAVSKMERQAPNSVLIAAQAADELLDINGINASFVLTVLENKIHISGRSRGGISVQLILEKLGGGGHLNMAGAQLSDMTVEEAEEVLVKAIEEYMEENEKK